MFEEKFALVLVLIGFYLADCVVFLRPTQALGTIALSWQSLMPWRRKTRCPRPGGMIALDFGLTFYPTRGYFPVLLNPLTPWASAFKTSPLLPSISSKINVRRVSIHRLVAARLSIRMMGAMLASHAGLLFVAIPYMLFRGQIERLLTFLAFDFIIAASIIAVSYPLVRVLRLQRGQFWSLAIQSLVCLPLSLNFPRKLALLAPAESDAANLMTRVPSYARWTVAQDFIAVLEYTRNFKPEAADTAKLMHVLSSLREELPVE